MERKLNVNEIGLQILNIDFWSPNSLNKGGMRIYWSSNKGFGTLDIVKQSGNNGEDIDVPEEKLILTASTESMDSMEDKAFTSKLLELLVLKLQVID